MKYLVIFAFFLFCFVLLFFSVSLSFFVAVGTFVVKLNVLATLVQNPSLK